MGIDLESKRLGGVVQLVANTEGWKMQQTEYHLNPNLFITGNPNVSSQISSELAAPLGRAWQTTKELRPTDSNGLKVGVNRIIVKDGKFITEGYITDYFTLWGIPRAAQEEFARHSEEVIINRAQSPDALYETSLPWGLCSHNTLLDENGDVLMMIRGRGQGFHAGRISVTEEEQMDPDRDVDPFNASYASYWEELGIFVPPTTIKLLGVAMEIGAAYPAYSFIGNASAVSRDIVEKWRSARDYNENTSLFSVPMSQIDKWLVKDEVTSDVWGEYLLEGDIAPDAVLNFHPTSPWRLGLVREYSKLA